MGMTNQLSRSNKIHIDKKLKIRKKYPEIKELEEPSVISIIMIMILIGFQWTLAIFLHRQKSLLLMSIVCFINCQTFFHVLASFIHENSHTSIVTMRYRWMITILLETGLSAFGKHHHYEIVHSTIHHPRLNQKGVDSECPYVGHISNLGTIKDRKLRNFLLFLELLPLGSEVVKLFRIQYSLNG